MTSSSRPYRTPAQLKRAAQRLRRLVWTARYDFTDSEVELLRKVSETLDDLAASRSISAGTMQMTRERFIEVSVKESGVVLGGTEEAQIRGLADKQWDAAHSFAKPWEDALKAIRVEAEK